MKYYLIKRILGNRSGDPIVQIFWSKIEDKDGMRVTVNDVGGWSPFDKSCKVLETVEVEDYSELDISKTTEYKRLFKNSKDNNIDFGWLDREGRVYYCNYHDHISLLDYLFNLGEWDAEQQGWVKIDKEKMYYYESFPPGVKLTPEQRNWLSQNGFEIFDED